MKNRTFELIISNHTNNHDEIISGEYDLNFTKKPIPLSLRNIPELNHPLHTIIEFIEPNLIKMADMSPKWRLRGIAFERDNYVIFKRKID